jgi:gephyrin
MNLIPPSVQDGIGEYPVIGVVTAGKVPNFTVTKGTVARITTGSPLPDGANAVIMVERERDLSFLSFALVLGSY